MFFNLNRSLSEGSASFIFEFLLTFFGVRKVVYRCCHAFAFRNMFEVELFLLLTLVIFPKFKRVYFSGALFEVVGLRDEVYIVFYHHLLNLGITLWLQEYFWLFGFVYGFTTFGHIVVCYVGKLWIIRWARKLGLWIFFNNLIELLLLFFFFILLLHLIVVLILSKLLLQNFS